MAHAFSSAIPSPHRLPFLRSTNDEAKDLRGGPGRDVILDPLTPGPTKVPSELVTPRSGVQGKEPATTLLQEHGRSPDDLPLRPTRSISPPSERRNRERISSIHGQSSSEGSMTEKTNPRLTLAGLRPRPRPESRSRIERVSGSLSSGGESDKGQYVSIEERRRRQHDGDYVDSPLAVPSRGPSRLDNRTPSPLGFGDAAIAIPAAWHLDGPGHSRDRSISGPSRGERELVRRALADEHGSGSALPKLEPLVTSGIPGTSASAPTSPTVPFPSTSSSIRPRSHSRRSTRLSLDLDRDPAITGKSARPRSSRSRSRSGSGSTPHSPTLPNGSVGIGPALGIVKASARLRAIVDHDQRFPPDPSSGPSSPLSPLSPSTSAMGSRSATPMSAPAPRRMLTDQTGSRSTTPGSSRSNSMTERQGNRRRTKSLMSPGGTGMDSDPTGRRARSAMLRERKRSTTVSKARTISDLNRTDGSNAEEARRTRKRGVTVHFPPTPMEVDGMEPGWETQGVRSLAGSASVPNQLGKGRAEEHGISKLANGINTRSVSDNNVGLQNSHIVEKERRRSRLSDSSSGDQNRAIRAGRRKGKERVRDRDRNRHGFEDLFEEDNSRRPDDENDPLKTLLASVDINNALRLISQTTLMPGGRQANLSSASAKFDSSRPASSIGSVRSNPDRIPEVFVAKAPPSVTATLAQVGAEDDRRTQTGDRTKPKDKHIDRYKDRLSTKIEESLKEDGPESTGKAFSADGRIRIRSRRGTMIEREVPKREEEHPLSRVTTVQSDQHDQTLSSDDEVDRRASSSVDHTGSTDDGVRMADQSNVSGAAISSISQAFRPATPVIPAAATITLNTSPSAPAPIKKKRLAGLFHLKHSRSVSGGKWKKDPKGKDKVDSDRDTASREVAEKDAAEHEAKVQGVLLSLPSHPRCEALAYQARSHFQAYYGLMGRSAEETIERPGQAHLRWNPLRVIRWRKQVLAEEKRRQNWDASVNEQVRAQFRIISHGGQEPRSHEGWNGQADGSSSASHKVSSRQASKIVSPPLRSAAALSRALANDPQAALSMQKSVTFKEWLVLPSEILAFLDCRGHVDYFVPSTDKAQDSLRNAMASSPSDQIVGVPIATPSRYARAHGTSPHKPGTSPGSYGTSFGNRSSVSFTSDPMDMENHQLGEGLRSRRSITKRIWATHSISRHHSHTSKDSEPGDRLVHVLKSPIDALKRHVLHHNSEGETDHDQSGAEYTAHQKHARLWRIAHPGRHRGSMDTTASLTDEQAPDQLLAEGSDLNPAAHAEETEVEGPIQVDDKRDQKPGSAHIEMARNQNDTVCRPEFEEVDTWREEQRLHREDLLRSAGFLLERVDNDLSPANGGFADVLETFKQSIVQVNQAADLTVQAPVIASTLVAKGEADTSSSLPSSFYKSPQKDLNHNTKRHLVKRSGSLLPGVPSTRKRRSVHGLAGHEADALATLDLTVQTLSERYDNALPKAVDLAQKQDNLQDQVSLLTTRAEQLRMKIDVDANGKIRRQRAHLQSLRLPKERSVDNWFYGLIKYLVNTALALIAAWFHVKRFFASIVTAIWRIVITPFSIVAAVVSTFYRMIRGIYYNGAIRMICILVVWTFILVNYIL